MIVTKKSLEEKVRDILNDDTKYTDEEVEKFLKKAMEDIQKPRYTTPGLRAEEIRWRNS